MSHRVPTKFWVAAMADATDPNGFGGLPYHLVEAGRRVGIVDGGFAFSTTSPQILAAKLLWSAWVLASTGRFGGFQYSDYFLRRIWRSVPRPAGEFKILNLFQLYPEEEMNRASKKYFYLDQTLNDVFDYYGAGANFSKSWRENILTRERSQYDVAERIIFRSNWAAKRAIIAYNLPEDRVRIVLPGANIPQDALNLFDAEGPSQTAVDGPLNMVFIGKDWRRKGLDRLFGAMRIAKVEGVRLRLTVIGVQASDVPVELTDGLNVQWVGFLDKSQDPLGFARLVSSFDIGVLLSRSEAGGVSLREFGRVGLPVIAPDTGGSPEFAMSEQSVLVHPSASDGEIARLLMRLASDRPALREKKLTAWDRRLRFDWRTAATSLAEYA